MLNRNDRVALRRNRAAVSWLSFLLIVFSIWIFNLYKDKSSFQDEADSNISIISECRDTITARDKTIDSLNKILAQYKQVKKDTFENKPVKYIQKVKESKKDSTNFTKLNTDSIKKDSIK